MPGDEENGSQATPISTEELSALKQRLEEIINAGAPTDWAKPNSDQPFGAPPGTIRSIISLVVIIAAVGYAGWEIYYTHQTPDWFIALFSSIATYYFGTRNAQTIMDVLRKNK